MRSVPRGSVVLLVLVFALGLVFARTASADDAGAIITLEEPLSGLRVDVADGCQVRPADGGGSACQSFAASADKSDVFAVVLRPDGLLFYSVAMFVAREAGVGAARAQRIVDGMGKAAIGTPALVTYGTEAFLRTQLHLETGEATCFVTADDRPEVAILTFATEPSSFEKMYAPTEAVMGSLRRNGATAAPPAAPPDRTTPRLLSALFVLVVGLPVITVIARIVRAKRREQAAKR